jgi:uncharacterized membrane protein
MVGLGDLPGGALDSQANAVSADGSTVVGFGGSASGQRAFIWDPTHGMRELDQVLTGLGLSLTGWTLSTATGVSADGQTIVGSGIGPEGTTEAWLVTIPEPGTVLLIGVGLAGLHAAKRLRGV